MTGVYPEKQNIGRSARFTPGDICQRIDLTFSLFVATIKLRRSFLTKINRIKTNQKEVCHSKRHPSSIGSQRVTLKMTAKYIQSVDLSPWDILANDYMSFASPQSKGAFASLVFVKLTYER